MLKRILKNALYRFDLAHAKGGPMKKENLWPDELTAETLKTMKEIREKAEVAQKAARKFENEYLCHPGKEEDQ